ncbi:Transducin/WD40 repeat-like superfamily protein, partial [Striga hermonthica]
MPSPFHTAVLGSSIVYPNAVAWSEENLVAVAGGNTVTILNPGNPGARGVITIPVSKPFPLGVVDGEGRDLLNGCTLPCILARDNRPCVRSISWSPVGLANNAGCLLAVCTTAGRVKLYRFPFCEFSVEWIEVLDISELLYNHFKSTNFGDNQIVSTEISDVIARKEVVDYGCADEPPVSSLRKGPKRKKQNAIIIAESDSDNLRETNTLQLVPVSFYKSLEKVTDDRNLPILTKQQYASRSEMLMSIAIAWSPILGTSGNGVASPQNSSDYCSVLAVGGKCGRLSFWRIHAPDCYAVDNPKYSSNVLLVGLLKAHDAWITAINWAICGCNDEPQLILATGSSDGSVKIWLVNGEELLKSSEVIYNSFTLFKEAIAVDHATISVLSLTIPSQSPWRLFLAVGKGSGSFEVWIIDMLTCNFDRVGCYSAHDRIVTGLTWAFSGRCLYSCGQENSVKSWMLVENSLCEVPIPSYSPGLKSSCDVPYAFDSCFGLTVSPGNLAIAVARGFDIDLLHPMYQGRSHRAAIEFFWIGGQQLDSSFGRDTENKPFPGIQEKELVWWERNLLWSLDQYADFNRFLTIWDIMTALLAFKQSSSGHTECILLKWLTSHLKSQFGNSVAALPELIKCLPKVSSRHLHLINIISRRVVLKGYKADNTSGKQQELENFGVTKDGQANKWMEFLSSCESELLERLVRFCFSTMLSWQSNSSVEFYRVGCWSPDGLAQMEQWVSKSGKNLKDHTKFLAAEVGKVEKRRLKDLFRYDVEEWCNFCSAVVPFESKDNAVCSGVSYDNGTCQKHKLKRCAISMQILPTKPS